MSILASQKNELLVQIEETAFDSHAFEFDLVKIETVIKFGGLFFKIRVKRPSVYTLHRCPGRSQVGETIEVNGWPAVVDEFKFWLSFISREMTAIERRGADTVAPEWVLNGLPQEYHEVTSALKTLQETERRWQRMAQLLWQTGEPLNIVVRDAFRDIGYQSELTAPRATYDVTVTLPTGRLLIEVTGIEGQINKGSKKIAQVVQTQQTEAKDGDRVCVAVNAYRLQLPAERDSRDIVTNDALRILSRLDAVLFTTGDLFNVWLASKADASTAQDQIQQLLSVNAGVIRLGMSALT